MEECDWEREKKNEQRGIEYFEIRTVHFWMCSVWSFYACHSNKCSCIDERFNQHDNRRGGGFCFNLSFLIESDITSPHHFSFHLPSYQTICSTIFSSHIWNASFLISDICIRDMWLVQSTQKMREMFPGNYWIWWRYQVYTPFRQWVSKLWRYSNASNNVS